jgi:hypothetical protein
VSELEVDDDGGGGGGGVTSLSNLIISSTFRSRAWGGVRLGWEQAWPWVVGLGSISGDGDEGELALVDGVKVGVGVEVNDGALAEAEAEAEKEAEECSTAGEDEEGVDGAGFGFVDPADKVDVEAAGGAEDGSLDEDEEALRALYATEINTNRNTR